MAFGFRTRGSVLLVIVHLWHICVDHTTLAQETTVEPSVAIDEGPDPPAPIDEGPDPPSPGASNAIDPGFIEPQNINDEVDMFTYKSYEYLFVNIKVMHEFAEMMCVRYMGVIASISDVAVADFLADALSETNLEFESLWLGGKSHMEENVLRWHWIKNNYSDVISNDILSLIDNKDTDVDFERNCLAFARKHHEQPQFKNLDCDVERAFMCQRNRSYEGGNNSTHPGWITVGGRLYKIFREKVDYDTATINCLSMPNATLAIVEDMMTVQELGRYLLIGRPSLENAWIGARWVVDKYQFEDDVSILLENTTNAETKFPPWRNNTMRRIGGCLLLDRHLSSTTLFIEARCQRLRSYICSKPIYNASNPSANYSVVVIEDREYHTYYTMQPWEIARSICKTFGTFLAEPKTTTLMEDLLFVMGQNVSTLGHVWIGGKLIDNNWNWVSNGDPVDSSLPFIKNSTYIEHIEYVNTCLNLDRENHIVGLVYGTSCSYPQRFICQKTADNPQS